MKQNLSLATVSAAFVLTITCLTYQWGYDRARREALQAALDRRDMELQYQKSLPGSKRRTTVLQPLNEVCEGIASIH